MSLIYQALKKLEGMRYGYGTHYGQAVAGPARRGLRRNAFMLPAGILLAAALAALFALRVLPPFKAVERVAASLAPVFSMEGAVPSRAGAEGGGEDEGKEGGRGDYDYKTRAIELFGEGRFREAASLLKAAVDRNPSDPVLYNNLAIACMEQGDVPSAEEYLKKALRLRPDYPEALNNYGALLERRGEPEKALGLLEKAMGIEPGYADPYLNIAISLEGLERYAEAVVNYERFLRRAPRGGQLREEVKEKVRELRSSHIINFRGG